MVVVPCLKGRAQAAHCEVRVCECAEREYVVVGVVKLRTWEWLSYHILKVEHRQRTVR